MITAQAADTTDDESIIHTKEDTPFDTVLVFGEGPIKPILLPEELTPQQFRQLDLYNSDSAVYPEPDFWLMQQPRNLAQLKKIDDQKELSSEEKAQQKKEVLKEWQHKGWYALKRMGRQNAMAAGLALYKGITKEVILTGGRTLSSWTKNHIPQEILETWPSEAELMAEVIVSSYGSLYEKRYGKKIENAIKIETASTNTLENFSYSVNLYPQLHAQDKNIGFISAGHHMKRLRLLAHIFGINIANHYALASQHVLKDAEDEASCEIIDEYNCHDTKEQYQREARWIKALNSPEYLTYWLGYVAEVKKAYVLQKALNKLREKAWKEAGAAALSQVKLNVEEIVKIDVETLAKTDPQKYLYLVSALQQFKKPSLRILP